MHEVEQRLEPPLREVRAHRRRRAGQVPPARRLRHLRGAGAHGAGLLDALPADRRPGQLRLGRRRRRGRLPLHRVPAGEDRLGDAGRHRQAKRSTSRRTTTARSSSRRCCRRACPTCWSTAPRASRSAWRPTSRRTTSARWSTPACTCSPTPHCAIEELIKLMPAPDFPTAGIIYGIAGVHEGYRTGRGRVGDARAHALRGDRQGRPPGDHRRRAALPGEQEDAAREDRRAGHRQAARRHLRPRATSPTSPACAW